jgi:hypothetical protein
MNHAVTAIVVTLLALPGSPANAARPLFTEDADVLPRGECELEAFTERQRQSASASARAGVVQGGCGLGWQSQIGIGYGVARGADDRGSAWAVGGKTALHNREPGQIGLTLAWGLAFTNSADAARFELGTVALVATADLAPHWTAHANLGWQQRPGERDAASWNLAIQREVGESLELLAETYGTSREAPWIGVGARWKTSQTVSFNAGAGVQHESARPWQWSVGLRLGF